MRNHPGNQLQDEAKAKAHREGNILFLMTSSHHWISKPPPTTSILVMLLLSCSVVYDSWWPHGLQHARLPSPSLSHEICSNSYALNRWCHPTISSSVIPFSSLQFCPASGSFLMSQFFSSGGQYWNFSFSISPFNDYSGLIFFRMDCFDLLAVQGTFKSLLHNHNLKASVHQCLAFFMVQLPHPYMTTGKTTALTIQFFVSKVMPLLFNKLSRLVITFLPRSKRLLISFNGCNHHLQWFGSPKK